VKGKTYLALRASAFLAKRGFIKTTIENLCILDLYTHAKMAGIVALMAILFIHIDDVVTDSTDIH